MRREILLLILVMLAPLGVAGCTAEITLTAVALPSATPVPLAEVPATATAMPPTATAIPPTATTHPTDIPEPTATLDPTVFELRSTAFGNEEPIPELYTCDGRDISPPLEWGDPPEGTVSLALYVDDTTAGGFVHWLIFNIPPETRNLPEAVPLDGHFPDGSQQGSNTGMFVGYMGPCPPPQTNRYRFRLYALDTMLDLDDGVMGYRFAAAIREHVLARTEFIGLYYP